MVRSASRSTKYQKEPSQHAFCLVFLSNSCQHINGTREEPVKPWDLHLESETHFNNCKPHAINRFRQSVALLKVPERFSPTKLREKKASVFPCLQAMAQNLSLPIK